MTINEQLEVIEKNTPKVYESGKQAGYQEGVIDGRGEGYVEGYDNGYAEGKNAGIGEGYIDGYNEGRVTGLEDGQKTEYDRFWDAYQDGGKSKQYHYAFAGYGWNDETFKPKYDIIMRASCLGAFQYCMVTDIAERLKECGVVVDSSNCTTFQGMFAYATTKSIPALDASKTTAMSATFDTCRNLERIERLIVPKGMVYNNTFRNCDALKHIVFEGEIGNDLDLQYSPLSYVSIRSAIDHLSDTTTGKILSLNKKAVEASFNMNDIERTLGLALTHPDSENPDWGDLFAYDNGDGTIAFSGTIVADTYFYEVEDSHVYYPGTYDLFLDSFSLGTVEAEIYGLDGKFITGFNGWYNNDGHFSFTVNERFVIKTRVYLSAGTFNGEVLRYPTITGKSEFEGLKATKPNWTITLV